MHDKISSLTLNKYKKVAINIIVLTFILSGGISPTFATSSEDKVENHENSPREVAVLESFEDNDYKAWKKNIRKNSNLLEYVSEEKFNKFIEIRKLARHAHHDEALTKSNKFKKELEADFKKLSNTVTNQTKLLSPTNKKAENTISIAEIEAIKIKAKKNIT